MSSLKKRFVKVDLESINHQINKGEVSDFMALSMRERAELLLIGQRLKKAYDHEHLRLGDLLFLLSLEPRFTDEQAMQLNSLVQECISENLSVSSSHPTSQNDNKKLQNDNEVEKTESHKTTNKEVIEKPRFSI